MRIRYRCDTDIYKLIGYDLDNVNELDKAKEKLIEIASRYNGYKFTIDIKTDYKKEINSVWLRLELIK